MRLQRVLPWFALLGLPLSGSCNAFRSLPDCTEDREQEARLLVVDPAGQLQYAGQAMMSRSCASGQCHDGAATGSNRVGAPAELDFNLPLAAVGDDGAPNVDGLRLLRKHQQNVFDDRESIWDEIDSGRMPPDGSAFAGFRGEHAGLELVLVDTTAGTCSMREQLPAISTGQGKRIIESWLACGSPVVESSSPLVQDNNGDLVQPPAEGVGVTGNATLGIEPGVGQRMPQCDGGSIKQPGSGCPELAPTWTNVFNEVFVPTCVSGCHQPGGIWAQLDLSDKDAALAAILNVDSPSPCATATSSTFVIANDPDASYLLQKMERTPGICGQVMPATSTEPAACTPDLVRAWIAAGAQDD